MDKDFRIIISIILNTAHFYFTLNMYEDTITIINNAIELSHKYSCYDYIGNLWLVLGNCYSVLKDNEKAKEYFEKSNTYFKLLNQSEIYNQSMLYQKEIFENINT